MVVCPVTPFTVLAASGTELLGYHGQALLGQSFLRLKGPATDEWALTQAISGSALLKSSSAAVVLHCQDGTPQPSLVSCEPLILNASFIGCRMRILRLNPIALESCSEQFSRSSASRYLVQAASANFIHAANIDIVTKIGCSEIDVFGNDPPSYMTRPLRVPSPELMRILSFAGISPKTARTPFNSAPGTHLHVTSTAADRKWCEPAAVADAVRVDPVAQGANERPGAPKLERAGESGIAPRTPTQHPPTSPGAPASSYLSMFLSAADAPNAAAAAAATTTPKPPPEPSSAIRPRPLRGLREEPVVVTRSALQLLSDRPLPQAARALGVSATALKHACRRLGIRRWAHRRGPARRKGQAAPAGLSE